MDDQKKGIIYAFLVILLWATFGTSIKLLVSRVDSFVATVYIGLFATITILIYLAITRKIKAAIKELKKQPWFYIIAGIIGLGIQQVIYLKSYQLLPASQVVMLFYLYPLLMVVLSAVILKEKTSWKSWLFLLIGFAGVYILVSKGALIIPEISLGVITTLIAAFSWALFSVLIKSRKFDAAIGMFWFNLFGLLFLIALMPFLGFDYRLTLPEIGGIIYLAILPTALGFILWNRALQLTRTSICSNIALLMPPMSVVIIFLVLKEQIVAFQLVGLALILGSVFLTLNYGK